MMKLSGVMIGSADSGRLGQFYTKIFGQPDWQMDDWYGYDVGGANLVIGPHSEVKGKSQEPARVMLTLDTDDVKGEFERLKGLGAEVISEPYQPQMGNEGNEGGDMWLATLADADGNYLQLSTPWTEPKDKDK